MKKTFNSEKYGIIEYYENFWSGKKKVSINGNLMTASSKLSFQTKIDGVDVKALLLGNMFNGMTLKIDEEKFEVYPASKWYEYVLAILSLVLICVWGNSKALCSILPVVGGGIGGGISGASAFISLVLMKKVSNPLYKILIGLGMIIASFAICALIGIIILGSIS